MYKHVILIGFSTAGKSTYLKAINKDYPQLMINCLDSDKEIAKNFDGHIYNIYLELGRDEAIKYIHEQENYFLKRLLNEKDKSLIAAGPHLLSRENWGKYYNEKNPYIFYLKKNIDDIFTGLQYRRTKHRMDSNINKHPNFGIWDIDVMVSKNLDELPESEAKNNISNLLRHNEEQYYSKYANEDYWSTKDISKEFLEKILSKYNY